MPVVGVGVVVIGFVAAPPAAAGVIGVEVAGAPATVLVAGPTGTLVAAPA
jgi:hypothetical protein